MRTLISTGAAAVSACIVVAVAITGCTSSQMPVTTPSPAQTKTAPVVVVEQPAAIFGGDCSLLFPDAVIAKMAGGDVVPTAFSAYDDDNVTEDPRSLVFRQLGIIHCAWAGDDGRIALTVQHGDPTPEGKPSKECQRRESGDSALDPHDCVIDTIAHGVEITGLVQWPSAKKSRSIATRLSDHFNRADLSPGPAPVEAPGAWNYPESCADTGPIPIENRPVEITRYEPDILASLLPIDDEISSRYSGYGCYAGFVDAGGAQGDVHFTAVGGGAWFFDEDVAALASEGTVEETDVPGFDKAVMVTQGERRRYSLLSGNNYLTATILGTTSDVLILTAIRDNLDALAP